MEVYGLKGDLYCGNAEELDTFLPMEQYDFIYSFGVIHHSPKPHAIIKQLYKYLKPDGELRMMVYNAYSYKAFDMLHTYNKWHMPSMRKTIGYYSEAQTGSPVTFVYTAKEVESLLQPYFKIDKMWVDHVFTWDIEEYKKNNYVRAAAFEGITDEELTELAENMGLHRLVWAKKI